MRKCLFLAVFFFAALGVIGSNSALAENVEGTDKAVVPVVTPRGSTQPVYTESAAPSTSSNSTKVFYEAVDAASNLVVSALSYMGINYKFGGNEPDSGFDCSGFVRYVYNNTIGLVLPRSSAEMSTKGEKVKKDELKPGDLVFFNTLKRAFSHVGIYVGEGKFVHAPSTGGVVRVESMEIPYWQQRFNGARRMDTYTVTSSIKPAHMNKPPQADTAKQDALDRFFQDAATRSPN